MLELIALLLKIFSKAGGPEEIRKWTEDKLPELKAIHARLTGPDEPTPKG